MFCFLGLSRKCGLSGLTQIAFWYYPPLCCNVFSFSYEPITPFVLPQTNQEFITMLSDNELFTLFLNYALHFFLSLLGTNIKLQIDEQFFPNRHTGNKSITRGFLYKLTRARITLVLSEEACPIKMIDVEHTARGGLVGGANITHSCYKSDSAELLNETRGLTGVLRTDDGLDSPMTGDSH